MARVLVPLPTHDFDITEVVVPWKVLTQAGHEVVFATPEGGRSSCDPLLITGVVFGQLGALPENVALYRELEKVPGFMRPLAYADIEVEQVDALLLPGGHAPGMRSYLGSELLQDKVAGIWAREVPVGAICHGSLVLARSRDAEGRSIVEGQAMTCLPWWMEFSAWALTFWKLGRYYRTYEAYVQEEVEQAGAVFSRGPLHNDYDRPFLVETERLVTGRWPGDAQAFAEAFLKRL
jgi:putative intracellular protease/amidase